MRPGALSRHAAALLYSRALLLLQLFYTIRAPRAETGAGKPRPPPGHQTRTHTRACSQIDKCELAAPGTEPAAIQARMVSSRLTAQGLSAQPQRSDQCAVAFGVLAVQIFQHAPALADHLEQAATRMMVVLVLHQMARQVLNAARQNGNLHLWRAGVALVNLILLDNLRFLLGL